MGKVVDGVELLRMIRDGELTRFEFKCTNISFIKDKILKYDYPCFDSETKKCLNLLTTLALTRAKFEIISPEEDKEIDIQEMQEINLFSNGVNSNEDTRKKCYDNNFVIIEETLKEIIKAIKQLDKKIK